MCVCVGGQSNVFKFVCVFFMCLTTKCFWCFLNRCLWEISHLFLTAAEVKSWAPPGPKRWLSAHCGRMTHFLSPQGCRRSEVVLPLQLWPVLGKVLSHSWSSDQLTPEQKTNRERREKNNYSTEKRVLLTRTSLLNFLNDLPLGSSCASFCLGCLRPICKSLWPGWLAVRTL